MTAGRGREGEGRGRGQENGEGEKMEGEGGKERVGRRGKKTNKNGAGKVYL